MDLAQYDLNANGNEGRWVDILSPAGAPLGLAVKVAGSKSDRVLKAVEQHDRRLREAMSGKKIKDDDFDRLQKQRDEEVIAAAVLDWRMKDKATVTFAGDELACTPESVRRVLLNPGFDWLAAQVLQAARDAALFTTP